MTPRASRPLLIGFLAASAVAAAMTATGTAAAAAGDDSRFTSSTFAGLALRGIGPALMSGRVADLAIHPTDRSIWNVSGRHVGWGDGAPREFAVAALDNQSLPAAEPAEALAFARRAAALYRQVQGAAAELDTAKEKVDSLEKPVFETPGPPTALLGRLRATRQPIAELEIADTAYAQLALRLRTLIESELPEIERALEQAGAPWTPGRRPLP